MRDNFPTARMVFKYRFIIEFVPNFVQRERVSVLQEHLRRSTDTFNSVKRKKFCLWWRLQRGPVVSRGGAFGHGRAAVAAPWYQSMISPVAPVTG